MKKLTHQEILDRQQEKLEDPRLSVTVILNNIRSLHNVGSIFRTSDGAGVEKIWLCGITGYPPNPQIAKTALDAQEHVPWEYAEDPAVIIDRLKSQGYQIVLLEQTQESIPYDEFIPQGPVCLILGNEIEGISEGILSKCDTAIEINMAGIKHSLNVSVAFGVVIYRLKSCLLALPRTKF